MAIRRRWIATILVAFLVSATLLPVLPAQEDDADDEQGPPDERPPDHAGPPDGEDEPRAGVGHVERTDDRFDGRFISLTLTPDGFENLTYRDHPILASFSVDALTETEIGADGPRIHWEGETADGDVEVKLHDTPTAFTKLEFDRRTRSEIVVAEGVNVSRSSSRSVELSTDAYDARIWWEQGDVAVNGSTLTVDNRTEMKLLVAHRGASEDADRSQRRIVDAAARGAVGAEVRMVRGSSGADAEIASMSDLDVLASAKPGGVVVLVSSENRTGRTVVLHLDPSLLDGSDLDLKVNGDGIERAESLDDVLDPTNDGNSSEFVTAEGAQEIQVLVSLPHFSTNTIEVASVPGSELIARVGLSPTQAAAALLAAVATVGVAAVAAGRRD